jgi:PAS domain S-box-containing protein
MLYEMARWLLDSFGLGPAAAFLLGEPGLPWLHVAADVTAGLAYFAIAMFFIALARRGSHFGFRACFVVFTAFFLIGGAACWADLATLWLPAYGALGLAKTAAAATSIMTAVVLWRLMPWALALPSSAQALNSRLDELERSQVQLAASAAEAAGIRDRLRLELLWREAAEKKARENEHRLRLVLQSNVTEALYLLDPEGIIESWNAGAERIKGYTSAEVIGRNFAMFFTPEDIACGEPARVLANAREKGRFATEAWRVRKDGVHFLASVALDAIRREDGTLRGFVKVTLDITNRRIEEEQRAILIEAAPNGLMIVDEAGVITLANSQVERTFGYPPGTLVGQSVEILVPVALRGTHATQRSAFTSGRSDLGMSAERQFAGRKRDGGEVMIEIMLSTVKTPRGRISVASLFDVTERIGLAAKRHEAEERERAAMEATNASLGHLSRHLAKARDRADLANRAKSRFLAGMSHELRTPLNGILGYAHLLRMEGGLTLAQAARVDAMLEAGKHLLEMITCVLDLSEIEAERVEIQAVDVDVRAVATACLDLVRPMADAKGLGLSMTAETGVRRTLITDPTRLRQILLNLLGNATKYTQQGKVNLHLRTSADGGSLRIEVVDSGAGISAELRHRLFQDYERFDAEATNKVEGAGLGLALSARLATMMGGRLGQEDNPSGGSVFWLELPVVAVPLAAEPPDATVSPIETVSRPVRALHVLVVDDVLMNRDIASSFLSVAGHKVLCVEGGAEAVAAAANADFDVILMDVRMPEMDGLEATRRIRALTGPRARVPIVALTAQAFTDQIAQCREAGMSSHLAKPFDPETLLAAVEKAITAEWAPTEDLAAKPTAQAATVAPTVPAAHKALPIRDPAAFDRTASMLAPEATAAYLRTITELSERLLDDLRKPGAVTPAGASLGEAAHTLAGSAGMFGFERLSTIARHFERATQAGTADAAAMSASLIAVLEATIRELHELSAHAVPG